MVNKIEKHIKLLDKAHLDKDEFVNDELKPSAKTSFKCSDCNNENDIEIIPYQTGFPFKQIYKNRFLSESDILDYKIALHSSSSASHLGDYLVYDLPTLYFVKNCSNCMMPFLVVFGCGESQPSKWVCKISGIWGIEIQS